jgi:hypothetical protein
MSFLDEAAAAPFTDEEIARLGQTGDGSGGGDCIMPVPTKAGALPAFKKNGREADHRYEYRGSDGGLLGYVLRWDARGDCRKEFSPASYWRNGTGKGSWQLKTWPGKRPLFGLDQLAARSDAIVLLTEGEKAAEAVKFGPLADAFTWAKHAVIGVTWPGGTNAIKHADFSPLAGRDVILLPDNDQPGEAAADELVSALGQIGLKRLRRWRAPTQARDKWDIADELPDGISPEAMVETMLQAPEIATRIVKTLEEFLADFQPPDYLLDGILQRRFVYSLTAQTGHGKTALALLIARIVGGSDPKAALGKHAAEKGQVVYFAGENPDDLRMRVLGDEHLFNDNKARISFIPGTFSIEAMRTKIEAEIKRLGGVDLVIIDTSAAYFLGKDELSNTEMGAHARLLRTLTTLPGGPCILVLCHPVKHVTDPSQLLPRGGGAFLAEVDGNLTLWKHDGALLDLHHTDKLRGPGFDPISLRLETVTTTRLMDKKGRIIPTVRAVWISDAETERETEDARSDEDALLKAMLIPGQSIADLATACGWCTSSGEPYKSKVQRVLKRLDKDKLVVTKRGVATLTDSGKTSANAAAGRRNERKTDARSTRHEVRAGKSQE